MPFHQPLRIAGKVFQGIPAVRVFLHGDGITGRGEASGVYYTGDDTDSILTQLERVRDHVEAGIDRATLQQLLPAGGARNALDAALWEHESLQRQKPVWAIAGLGMPKPLTTTFTLSADPPDAVEEALATYGSAKAIKLKLDGDLSADGDRLRLVRKRRPDAWLMVDANQGYSIDRLDSLIPLLVEARVTILEQPVQRGQESGLEYVKCPIPFAADESLLGLADLPALVGRFQIANIKLDKCGGLTEAFAMAHLARKLGLRIMVGNMAGSSLAAAPAFLLGQLCDFVDLDGPTFIAHDLPGGVRYQSGEIFCPEAFWGASSH